MIIRHNGLCAIFKYYSRWGKLLGDLQLILDGKVNIEEDFTVIDFCDVWMYCCSGPPPLCWTAAAMGDVDPPYWSRMVFLVNVFRDALLFSVTDLHSSRSPRRLSSWWWLFRDSGWRSYLFRVVLFLSSFHAALPPSTTYPEWASIFNWTSSQIFHVFLGWL